GRPYWAVGRTRFRDDATERGFRPNGRTAELRPHRRRRPGRRLACEDAPDSLAAEGPRYQLLRLHRAHPRLLPIAGVDPTRPVPQQPQGAAQHPPDGGGSKSSSIRATRARTSPPGCM
ncbi:MAG: Choline-sulfatase, partial [uncultured Thermomicrobiales bacterium]